MASPSATFLCKLFFSRSVGSPGGKAFHRSRCGARGTQMASPRFFRGLFTLTFPSSNTAPGRIASRRGLFLLRFRIVPVFFPGGNAAADMPLGFIHFQHMPDASVQLRVHRLKAVGHVFMFRRDELERFRPSPNHRTGADRYPHSRPCPPRSSG